MRNQLKGLTANYNGCIIVIYVNADKCRLGFCPGLWLYLFRIASGGLICEPFLHADFLAVYPDHATVAGSYPCKCLFDVLRLFIACMCILSTAIAKSILGTFTGFIMISGYYIISRLTAL